MQRTRIGVGDFIVQTCQDRAMAILTNQAPTGAAVPAKPEDVTDPLAELVREELAKHKAEQDARMDALAGRMDEQANVFAELRRLARRGRWR
jgi:hypothetical protein